MAKPKTAPVAAATPSLLAGLTVANPTAPKGGKTTAPAAALTGLARYAAFAAIGKEIDGILKGAALKTEAMRRFVAAGRASKKAPDSFSATEGNASASVQYRKKDNRTSFNADKVALFTDLGIALEHNVTVPGAVIVNPIYMTESDSLEKLLVMAQKAGFPADYFQMQQEVARDIANDDSITQLFSLGANTTDDRMLELANMLGGVTVVPKWKGTLAEAVAMVQDELTGAAPPPASETAANDTAPAAGSNLLAALKASLEAEEGKAA